MNPIIKTKRKLPEGKLIVSYATSDCSFQKIINEAKAGVNVLVWFTSSLLKDTETEKPSVEFKWDIDFIGRVQRKLLQHNLTTTHLVCVGGWNAPHPDTSFTGKEWFEAWEKWIDQLQAKHPDFLGFDGIDWDLEGNDNGTYDTLNPSVLNIVGEMSQELKKNGYIISLVPPQSYFDFQSSEFSHNIYLPPADPWHQDFCYTGRNVYAYWLAKFGTVDINEVVKISSMDVKGEDIEDWEIIRIYHDNVAIVDERNIDCPMDALGKDSEDIFERRTVPTFDFIDIQFYESYSRSGFAMEQEGLDFTEYFVNDYIKRLKSQQWMIKFSKDSDLPDQEVKIDVTNQLVIGFGAKKLNDKMNYISPDEIEKAWLAIKSSGLDEPRGLMFWNLGLEPDETKDHHNMSSRFNKILQTRQ